MNLKQSKYGYRKEEVSPEHYVLGANSLLTKVILQENGQWDSFLPQDEFQNLNGIEPMACTTFGTLNIIEILFKRIFNTDINFSDRYTAIASGTTSLGCSPQVVAEGIRKDFGLILESELPFDSSITTFELFYSPKPLPQSILKIGKYWLNVYGLGHEWVFTTGTIEEKQRRMKEALQYSPLGVSVYAWDQGPDDLYVKNGEDNHWCVCYGYEDGKYWKVFDSYDNSHKKLDWNYDFGAAKRYTLDKVFSFKQPTLWEKIVGFIKLIFKIQ